MGKAILCIIEDYVAVKPLDSSIRIIPTAEEVFTYAFQNGKTLHRHEIREIVPRDLQFSRFPTELRIHLRASPSESGLHISCDVVAKATNQFAIVQDPLHRAADHVVISGTWYPFAPGALKIVREILRDSGVTDPGSLTLAAYFALSRKELRDFVEDLTDHQLDAARTAAALGGAPPLGLSANLYPYQLDGYNWLRTVCAENIGCILADEMGLGKTLQVIAVLLRERDRKGGPSLIIVPATLIENWTREIKKFAPTLGLYVHQGSDRTGFPSHLQGSEVTLTSYETLVRDISMMRMVNWNIVVADEAQAIKNPDAKRSGAMKTVPRRAAIAVTGTPLENRLRDLWSIADFALPGLLGGQNEFEKRYADCVTDATRVEPIVTPILLRRKLSDVARDLPERIDIPQPVELGQELAGEYEGVRAAIEKRYGDAATLVSLAKLRQFCVHPLQLTERWGDPSDGNNKYQRFVEILEEIFANAQKVLVFLSYHHACDLFSRDVCERFGVYVDSIDGRVPVSERQTKVDQFEHHLGPAALFLNPRTAGTGLNLTAANHVILYAPDWNPAVEDQASARAYRRGQTLPVTVHRLFFIDTVEDIIIQRLEFKRELAQHAVVGSSGETKNHEDIMRALRISPLRQRHAENGC